MPYNKIMEWNERDDGKLDGKVRPARIYLGILRGMNKLLCTSIEGIDNVDICTCMDGINDYDMCISIDRSDTFDICISIQGIDNFGICKYIDGIGDFYIYI